MKNIIKTFTIFSLIFLAQNFGFATQWCNNGFDDKISAFSGVSGAEGFCALTQNIAKDNKNVYEAFSGIKIISGADASSFQLINSTSDFSYFGDSKYKYFCDLSGCNIISSGTKFNILKDKKQNLTKFSYDGKDIFFENQKLTKVNKSTFSPIQGDFGEDINSFFKGTQRASKTNVQNICNALGLKDGGSDKKNISRYENVYRFVPLDSGQQAQYILSGKNLVTKNIGTNILTGTMVKTAQKQLVSTPAPNISTDTYGNEFYQYDGILIVKPAKKVSFDFVSSGSSVKNFMIDNDKSFVMNGSYFGYQDGKYVPAGTWMSGEIIEVGQTQPQSDINLRVVVRLDTKNQNLQFFYNDDYNISWEENVNYVNAGPWIFRDGIINDIISKNYSHRGRETYRTAILSDSNGQIYFVIDTAGTTISDLANFIDKTNMFYCGFNMVNVDGGSSTAYISQNSSFNADKKLPIFFSIGK